MGRDDRRLACIRRGRLAHRRAGAGESADGVWNDLDGDHEPVDRITRLAEIARRHEAGVELGEPARGEVEGARAPLDADAARAALGRLRLVQAVAKGRTPPDLDALARFVAEFSQVVACAPWKRFVVEVNPVKWSNRGVTAVDGLVIIEEC